MTPYIAEDWKDFFIAAAGASAALAGLVIVAMSVNINQILKFRHLPARAAAAIGTLILILISSMAGLIHQSTSAFGVELLLFGIGAWVMELRSNHKALAAKVEFQRPHWESLMESIVGQIQTLPFIVAGVLLLTGNGHGMYWMAGGVLAIFVFSTMNAWVLLVEILR
jgi:modulator of FtsH protease